MFSDRYENFLNCLSIFKKSYINGDIIDKNFYQYELLSSILNYYEYEFNKYIKEIGKLRSKYKSLFIFLPSNIPVEFLQFILLIFSYDFKVFFKLPSREKSFIKKFFNILKDKKIVADFLEHDISIKKAKKYDFIIGSGSVKLGNILKNLNRSYRFFGPKFSFAVLKENNPKYIDNIISDYLSFDTEGCLSTRFLFSFEQLDFNYIKNSVKNLKKLYYPQKTFNKNVFYYYNEINRYYSKKHILTETEAVFEVKDKPVFFPQRTLFIKQIKKYEDIIEFLGNSIYSVQSITTETGKNIKYLEENSSASIFLPFGKSQFPPIEWMFEKGLNINNFFKNK
jgi:hypothetical protein